MTPEDHPCIILDSTPWPIAEHELRRAMEREMAFGFLGQLSGAAGVRRLGNNVTSAEAPG